MNMDISMGIFAFVAIIAVAVFTLQSVVHWTNAQSTGRRARERHALLAKLAEQPRDSADLVIALLREEDAKDEARRLDRRRARRAEGMQAGLVLVAAGTGLGVFLAGLDTSEAVWPIGLMLVLIGLVLFAFAYFSRMDSSKAG